MAHVRQSDSLFQYSNLSESTRQPNSQFTIWNWHICTAWVCTFSAFLFSPAVGLGSAVAVVRCAVTGVCGLRLWVCLCLFAVCLHAPFLLLLYLFFLFLRFAACGHAYHCISRSYYLQITVSRSSVTPSLLTVSLHVTRHTPGMKHVTTGSCALNT